MKTTTTLLLLLVTVAVVSPADKVPLELMEVISGALTAKGFDGSWISGHEFQRTGAEGVQVYDAETHGTSTLLGAQVLAGFKPSSVLLSADRNYVVVGFDREQGFRHSSSSRFTALSVADGGVTQVALGGGERLQLFQWAPSGNAAVYVLDNDVFYLPTVAAPALRVTDDGQPGVVYNGVADWVYEEEVLGSGSALWFSPDGARLAFARFNDTEVEELTYMHYGTPGAMRDQYPTPVTIRYPKVGSNNPDVTLFVADLGGATPPQLLSSPTEFAEPVLLTVTWADADAVAVQWANRVQNVVQTTWYAAEAAWAATPRLRLSRPDGWLSPPEPVFVDAASYLTIASQNNFSHLTLVRDDVATAVTSGNFEVTDIYGVAPDGVTAFFRATEAGFPSRRQVFSTPLTGAAAGTPTCLSCGLASPENRTCLWASASFSADLSRVALTCAGPDPGVVTLHQTGAPDADVRVLEANQDLRTKMETRLLPELLDDSLGGAQVRLWLPPGIDRGGSEKAPTIVYVYAGPGSQQIGDAFKVDWGSYLATNRRYVYAMVDGRGSGYKGDATLFAVNRRLGTVEIQDQIAVAKALKDKYPFVDGARTAIWGWSYGGYATAMALAQDVDDVFKCGVSVAPVSSWIYYDSIYTERYMGLPTPDDNEAGYNASDVTRLAANFRNKTYFLLHGSGDDNVHYQNSMLLARALEDAEVLFRQQSYADENHGLGHVLPHVYRSMDDFWQRCFATATVAAPRTTAFATGGAALGLGVPGGGLLLLALVHALARAL